MLRIMQLRDHAFVALVLVSLVSRCGEGRAPLALGLASLMFGFPIFFDAGLIVMLPVVFAVARRLEPFR